MTTETTTGEDGLHVLIEIEASGNLRSIATDSAHRESEDKQTKAEACPGITNHLLGAAAEVKMCAVKATQCWPVFRT
jgi:hypothetical protein